MEGFIIRQVLLSVCYLSGLPTAGIRIPEEEEGEVVREVEEEEEVSATYPPLSHFSLNTAKSKGRQQCWGVGAGVTQRAKGAVGPREEVAV